MLREKAAKLIKVAATSLMLAFGVAAAAKAVPVQADMLEEVEPNDNRAEATVLPLNTWIRGTTEKSYEEDWYKFTITEKGPFQMQIKPAEDNINEGSRWYVVLQDENRNELYSFYGYVANSWPFSLRPGTYYAKVRYRDCYGSKITYNFRVWHEASDSWDEDFYYGYKSYANANSAIVNRMYTGVLYCGDDIDYYHFSLSGTNNVSLKFVIDDTVANPGRWKIEFVEYNTKKSLSYTTTDTNRIISVPKCNGDLVVRISSSSGARFDKYHIQLTVDSAATPTVTPVPTATPAPTATPTPAQTITKPSATRITSLKAGKKKATISWKKVSGATGYYVYRSTSKNGTYKKIATVKRKTTYIDKKSLKSKKYYYYKVVTYKKYGSKVAKSKMSSYKKVKIK